MTLLSIAFSLIVAAPQAGVLEERIDLYHPVSGAFLGTEITWFTPDGERLRRENRGADGDPTLLFFVLHDENGREAGAIYFEGDAQEPVREVFGYEEAGRVQTVTYFHEPGVPGEQTSTDASESSPSFARDGATMVFARYDDDWAAKKPFIAYLEEGGWRVELLEGAPVEGAGFGRPLPVDVPATGGRRVRCRDGYT